MSNSSEAVILILIALLSMILLYMVIFRKEDEKKVKRDVAQEEEHFMERFYSAVSGEIAILGFAYDAKQDIFYSLQNTWQREFGYNRIYDDAAAKVGMIIDCEPIRFFYKGKEWLVEFWKGQYGIAVGGEIGVYARDEKKSGENPLLTCFYACAEEKDYLEMSYTLRKKDKILFTRKDVQWWLAGFKLGEYARPKDLTMDVSIVFRDVEMAEAFVYALLKVGYKAEKIYMSGSEIRFVFGRPYTEQPKSQISWIARVNQSENRRLCLQHQEALSAVKAFNTNIHCKEIPGLYEQILSVGQYHANKTLLRA